MKKLSLCPKCNKKFKGYPAISREDNKTKICPTCGLIEAIFSLRNAKENTYEKARSI